MELNINLVPEKRPPTLDFHKAKKPARQLKISDKELEDIFQIVGRDLTLCELGVFGSMWSEHCSYKSSRVHLKRLPTGGDQVVHGPGENAGVVRIKGSTCIVFKMESHNHPSFIDPYQGAATGVGGILRDVFCMGARPIALANCLRFGKKNTPKTKWLFEGVAKGISNYGNCVGVPNVEGNIDFDSCYNGNNLVNAMAVGIAEESEIFTGHASGVGNLIVYVGSDTGKDGVNGATMASDEFSSTSKAERHAIQVGDPFAEKLLIEVTLEALKGGLVEGLQDMGAAGLTSSLVEMAGRAGNGIYINLDLVPKRVSDMSAYELMLSESQERMALVVNPSKWNALQEILKKWGLPFAIIGKVTNTGKIQASLEGQLELDLEVSPLCDNAPELKRPMDFTRKAKESDGYINSGCLENLLSRHSIESIFEILSDAMNSKKSVFSQYDRHIGSRTVLASESQSAAVIRLHPMAKEDFVGVAISSAGLQRACQLDSFAGAKLSVVKAVQKLACVGGKAIAVTDCMNFGNPEKSEVMASFSNAIDGISEACKQMDISVVSGNVSFYNDTDGVPIKPTPMIGAVGRVEDIRKSLGSYRPAEASFYVVEAKSPHSVAWGGSKWPSLLNEADVFDHLPQIDWEAQREILHFMTCLSGIDGVNAIAEVGDKGVVGALYSMEMKKLKLDLSFRDLKWWFANRVGSFVVASDKANRFEEHWLASQLRHSKISKIK